MTLYRIAHWQKHFENHKSRSRETCAWVKMPNKQDGMGLQRILAEPDGIALFGVWCLILQKCSRQPAPRDGWLTDDGSELGSPWDTTELAFQWRQSADLLERAIATFCSPRIGWMEMHASAVSKGGVHSGDTKPPKSVPDSRKSVPDSANGGHQTAKKCPLQEEKEGKEGRKTGGREIDLDGVADAAAAAAPPADIDPATRWPYEMREPWVRRLKPALGNRLSANTWPEWKRLVSLFSIELVAATLDGMAAKARWPSEVEDALREADQPAAGPTQWTLDDMATSYPQVAQARALVTARGWEWARRTWGYTEQQVRSEAAVLEILRTDVPASEELVAKAKAGA